MNEIFLVVLFIPLLGHSQVFDGKWESGNGTRMQIQSLNEGFTIKFNDGANLIFTFTQPSCYWNEENGLTCRFESESKLVVVNSLGVEEIFSRDNSLYGSQNVTGSIYNGTVRTERHRTVNEMANLARLFIQSDKNSNNTQSKPEVSLITHDNSADQLQSDIDINIPVGNVAPENRVALIIGNENYKQEIKVLFAKNDASSFADYCNKTLGIPHSNIKVILDGTYGEMLGAIEWLNKVIGAFKGKSYVYFYYAGHGMPDEVDKSPYFLPVDGSSDNLSTGIRQDFVFNKLSENPAELVTIILDACFSGGAREGMLAQGRGVSITPKEKPLSGNLVIFSATSTNETALPYSGQRHGLFTYFLLKGMKETGGKINYGEMMNYLTENVTRNSLLINGKEQNPKIMVSNQLYNHWEKLEFNH